MDLLDSYVGTKYSKLVSFENYDTIHSKIRSYKSKKQYHIYCFSLFLKTKVDPHDSLPIEKRLTLHSVIIFIKSVLNKDKSHYYYKLLLEKCFYQFAKK